MHYIFKPIATYVAIQNYSRAVAIKLHVHSTVLENLNVGCFSWVKN